MTRLLLALALVMPATVAGAAPGKVHAGFAVRHNSLARVAALRGMRSTGVLFASPLAPLGTRLCVRSDLVRDPICGTVVDIPQPSDRAWQLAHGRIIEVQRAVAVALCRDPTGLPKDCPVDVWIEGKPDAYRNGVRSYAPDAGGQRPDRPKVGRRMVRGGASYAGEIS